MKNTGTGTSGSRLLDNDLDLPGMEALLAAGDVEPPADRVISHALIAVRAAAQREESEAAATAAPSRRRLRRRTITVGAVLAGVAAAAILPTVSIDGSKPTASAQAAEFLNSMAAKASGPALGSAPYWKVSTLIGGDQSPVPVNEYYSRTTFTTELATKVAGKPVARKTIKALPGQSTRWFGDQSNAVYWDDLATLPTDPTALAKRLEGDWGNGTGAFTCVGDLLGTAPVSQKVRSALFQVLARMPGVKLVGTVHDANGRVGKELVVIHGAHSKNPETDKLIIDPTTGKLLQQEYSNKQADTRITFLSEGPADRIG